MMNNMLKCYEHVQRGNVMGYQKWGGWMGWESGCSEEEGWRNVGFAVLLYECIMKNGSVDLD